MLAARTRIVLCSTASARIPTLATAATVAACRPALARFQITQNSAKISTLSTTTASTAFSAASPFSCLSRALHATPIAAGKIVPYLLADIGEGITECELIQWFVKPGDRVEQFSKICEVQSDKAAVEITSRFDGVVKKIYYNAGEIARVGNPLVDIELDVDDQSPASSSADAPQSTSAPTSPAVSTAAESAPQPAASAGDDNQLTFATPAVRRIAKEHNVDLRLVKGSGPDGRILKGDVLAFVNGGSASAAQPLSKSAPSASVPTRILSFEDEVLPLTPIQKAMFKAMTRSLQIPHFGYSDEIVLDATTLFRKTINDHLAKQPHVVGTLKVSKISYMPIFLKALSTALKQFPILNACVVDADTPGSTPKLLHRSSHNIGIAMDTPQGLIVPNVKNVQDMSVLDIAIELERLKEAGKKGGIAPADLQGGTITLSNIGNIGGTVLHPVLVATEVCIGAIGRAQRLPRFETSVDPATGAVSERVVAKEILSVSFNADHRVIDGATVGRFVQLWKAYLETPALLTADLK